jgi:hypothetical protein
VKVFTFTSSHFFCVFFKLFTHFWHSTYDKAELEGVRVLLIFFASVAYAAKYDKQDVLL